MNRFMEFALLTKDWNSVIMVKIVNIFDINSESNTWEKAKSSGTISRAARKNKADSGCGLRGTSL